MRLRPKIIAPEKSSVAERHQPTPHAFKTARGSIVTIAGSSVDLPKINPLASRPLNAAQLKYLRALSRGDIKDSIRDPDLGRAMRSLQIRGMASLRLGSGNWTDTWTITNQGRQTVGTDLSKSDGRA